MAVKRSNAAAGTARDQACLPTIVPEDFDWPTLHNRKGLLERLNFVAQIDCSDLPPGPARDLFPDHGDIYFFAPMSGSTTLC